MNKSKSIEELCNERLALLKYLESNMIPTDGLKYYVDRVDISPTVNALCQVIEAQKELIKARELDESEENGFFETTSETKGFISTIKGFIDKKITSGIKDIVGNFKLDRLESNFYSKFSSLVESFNKMHSEAYFNHRKFFVIAQRVNNGLKVPNYSRDRLDGLLIDEAIRKIKTTKLPESFAETIVKCRKAAIDFAEYYVFASSYLATRDESIAEVPVSSFVNIMPVPFGDAHSDNKDLIMIGCTPLTSIEKQIFKCRIKEAIKTRTKLGFGEIIRSINLSDPEVTLEYLNNRDSIFTKCEKAFYTQGQLLELSEDFTLANLSGKKLSQAQHNDYKNKLTSLKETVLLISGAIDASVKGTAEIKEAFWQEIQASARKAVLNDFNKNVNLTELKDLRDFDFIEESQGTVRKNSEENTKGRVKTDIVKKALKAEREKMQRIKSSDPQLAKSKTLSKNKKLGGGKAEEEEEDE